MQQLYLSYEDALVEMGKQGYCGPCVYGISKKRWNKIVDANIFPIQYERKGSESRFDTIVVPNPSCFEVIYYIPLCCFKDREEE